MKADKSKKDNFLLKGIKKDLSDGNFIEGVFMRPALLNLAFLSFILAVYLFTIGNLKWGGSLIIFSFILNLYSIYQSLTDEPSLFRNLNLAFKLVLFIVEVLIFNFILSLITIA